MSDREEVCIILGTRPEIIKMAPVIRAVASSDRFVGFLVHTNQHYDDELSEAFFRDLELPAPDENLHVGSRSQAAQTAKALEGIESILLDRDPVAVLAQGDTNAVMSTAIASSKLSVRFGHVEAGIRSYDRSMPEEVNRVVADHVADLLFAPTEVAADNLAAEGIVDGVVVTGNTIVDACREHAPIADAESTAVQDLGLTPGRYVVATIHRPRNTDDTERLERIISALQAVPFPVVFPAHPRTRKAIDTLDRDTDGIILVEPVDYLDFLALAQHARVIVTDSGGIQEEASILEVPCLTVRPNTERPETVAAGVNELVSPTALAGELRSVFLDDDRHRSMRGHPDLYGDGHSGARIVESLRERV